MTNLPSIFAPPPGQGGNNNNRSAIGSSYTPSAAAGGYTPSAAAAGSTYVPSAAAGGYTPSAAAGGYVPSAAATGNAYSSGSTGGYQPSTAAYNSSTYTPSAAAGGYTSSSTNGYVPSPAAMGSLYTPSAAASVTSYAPSAAAPAPTPTFSQALSVPPPAAGGYNSSAMTSTNGYVPSAAASVAAYAPSPTTRDYSHKPQDKHEVPTVTAMPYGAHASALVTTSSYQHGNGPTNGVVTQAHKPANCHRIDYEIRGMEMQLVEIHLQPQATVIAEAGAMMYLEDDVDFKTKFGDGSEPKQGFFKKIMAAGGRLMTGESLFITHFTNQGQQGTRVAAFAAPYPGTILPIDMMELQKLYPSGNPDKPTSLICQKDAFLCAALGTKLEMHLHKKIGSGLFGGEGFILQKIKGDGLAFVHAGGCVIKRELKQGEKLRVDTGCLVAYTSPGIDNDIQMAPGMKTMFFGGEGLFLATLRATGPEGGTVWLQSLPFSRLCDRVVSHAPSLGGRRQDEGSFLTGGFGDLIGGK